MEQYKKIIDFIEEHFAEDECNDIFEVLIKTKLSKIYNQTALILQDESMPKDEVVIANLASGLLTSVSYKVGKLENPTEQHQALSNFARLTERLLIMLVSENLDDSQQIFHTLERSLRITCIQFGLDYKMLRLFFDFEKIKMIVNSLKIRVVEPSKESNAIKKQRYNWLEKGKIEELADILQKENYIKSKKEFFDLFLKPKDDMKVRWNEEKKFHLAHLLNRLFTENYAKIEGNKGYFSYAEKHFASYEQEFFPVNSLKKISSQISIFPEEFSSVTKDIDEILSRIEKC